MIILLVLTWYLIGSVGGLYFKYKINPIITGWDIVFLVTIGGVGGVLTVLSTFPFLPYEDFNWYKWLSKKVF